MEKTKNMRKQEKIILWPAYFDASKTRMEGRRISKNLAVPSPKMLEIEEAATKLGIEHETLLEKGYPKTPWHKPGMLLVEKKGSKEQTINQIAKQLQKTRFATPKQP
jgi:signal recognition particle subunit SRP19